MRLTTEERTLIVDALREYAVYLAEYLEGLLAHIGDVKKVKDMGEARIRLAKDLADSFERGTTYD